MKKLTRIVSTMLAATLVAGSMAGCGNSSSGAKTADGKANINILVYMQDHEKAVYKKLIEQYKKDHADKVGNINFQVTTQDEYNTKMTAAMTSKKLPDIFYVGPDSVRSYVDNGYVMPLDDMIAKNSIIKTGDLWPTIIKAYRYDGTKTGSGKLYALPKDLSTFAYAYNKDMFDKAGVAYPDPNKPYTYSEFLDVCKKLTKDNNGDGKTDQWGASFADAFMLNPFIYGNNGHYLNSDYSKVEIDGQKAFTDALQFYCDLTTKYKVTPTVKEDSAVGPYQRWLAGQVGFYGCGTWDVGAFMDKKTLPFKWDLCGWPVGDSGKTTTWLGTVGYAVSKTCQNPDVALDLISYLSTNLDGQKEVSGATGQESIQLPNIMSYAKGDFKKAVSAGTVKYPSNIDVMFNYIGSENNYNGIFTETTYTYNADWFNTFTTGLTDVKSGKKTVTQYIKEIQPKMQQDLNKAIALQNKNKKTSSK